MVSELSHSKQRYCISVASLAIGKERRETTAVVPTHYHVMFSTSPGRVSFLFSGQEDHYSTVICKDTSDLWSSKHRIYQKSVGRMSYEHSLGTNNYFPMKSFWLPFNKEGIKTHKDFSAFCPHTRIVHVFWRKRKNKASHVLKFIQFNHRSENVCSVRPIFSNDVFGILGGGWSYII